MRRTLAFAALLGALACGRTENAPPATSTSTTVNPWKVTVRPSDLTMAPGSMEPQLFTSASGTVILSWLELNDSVATLKFAERTGRSWSAPKTVTSGDDWFVSWADVPSVIRLADGTLVAQWLKNVDPAIEAYDLQLSYSRDEGKTWSRPFAPHHDGTRTQHGFASLFDMPGGGLGMVWLDGRQMELDTRSPGGGAMGIRFAAYDGQWKQTADMEVDGRVCECCPTTAAVTAAGVITAFRDRSPREIRDIHVSRLEKNAWTYATPVHVDNWEIDACPVNGPALSARASQAAVAWFNAKDDKPRAFAAFSGDSGRTWGEPIRVDDVSTLGHVDVELLEDGSAVAGWMEFANSRPSFRIRRVESTGQRSEAIEVTGAADRRVSGIPRLARHGDEVVLAWTESGGGEDGREQVKVATATP